MSNLDNFFSKENKTFNHINKYKHIYLPLLIILILMSIFLTNYSLEKPLISGEESYYHLTQTKEVSWENFYYYPLKIIDQSLPIYLIISLISIVSILLGLIILKRVGFSNRFTLIFLTLIIVTPTFIFSFSTIAGYTIFLVLLLSGFYFLTNKKNHLLAIIPFILATLIDLISSVILLLLLLIYFYLHNKEKSKEKIIYLVIFFAIVTFFVFSIPLTLGPFHQENIISDLISDFGGLSGVSLFTLILALIGLSVTWKRKHYYLAYIILPLILILFIYNTETIFYLSILTCFFATIGIIELFSKKWNLEILKKFTFLILILGILFSTLTYVDRISETAPTKADLEVLTWVKENLAAEDNIFSIPEKSYFISYYTNNQPFYQYHQKNVNQANVTSTIITSTYIDPTFPLLEENNLSIIYIPEMFRKEFPEDRGLLFLLKNERFKLIHSQDNAEVWMFSKE
jgi:hypothetical protein